MPWIQADSKSARGGRHAEESQRRHRVRQPLNKDIGRKYLRSYFALKTRLMLVMFKRTMSCDRASEKRVDR